MECEASAEGVLAATGVMYLAHVDPAHVRVEGMGCCQPRLGEASLAVETDVALAKRVYTGLERTVARGCRRSNGVGCPGGCTGACARKVLLACTSEDARMPDEVMRYVRLGFEVGPRLSTLGADPVVAPVDQLAKSSANEAERLRQFARFSHMADGSFLAIARPKAAVLPFAAGYFTARLACERFCLVDVRHAQALVHEAQGRSAIVGLPAADVDRLASMDLAGADGDLAAHDERYVRAMWKGFYDAMALPGRDASHRGYDLRKQFMPERLWGGLPELDPRSGETGGYVPPAYGGDHLAQEGGRLRGDVLQDMRPI
ncbi:MAG: DUF4130 domain-containing protein [Atopobiaceae bacterium]|jgi:probable DNA metabolism protein|nr:DUF4130 domain-containing protein [Atopobiaceae bacterium]MCI2207367.1 DUF4130 domain-containing protein [Atopobiaceae bacterium]